MNLKHLQYFVEIAKRESFTRAADDIYVSQSALSKAVKCLELELEVTLIDRTSKTFELTEEGRILLEEGEGLLNYVDDTQQQIRDKLHNQKRQLKVGIPPVISTAYFSYLIYKFRNEYPDIDLKVIEAGANVVQSLVDERKVDIGVVILPIIEPQNYYITPAMSSENVLIVSAQHHLAGHTEVSFAELANEDFLILNDTYMLHNKIINNCDSAGFYPHITTESSQWDFLAEMVALNQGISILPKPIVERFNSAERIKMIRLKEPKFPWNIAMIVQNERHVSSWMEDFIQFVTKNKDYVKGYI